MSEEPEFKYADKGSVTANWTRFFRPTGNMLQDLQNDTGIPFWTWHNAVELGRTNAEKYLAEPSYSIIPRLFKGTSKRDRELTQMLFEARGTDEEAAVLKGLGARAPEFQTRVDQLQSLYLDYFGKLDFTPEDVADLLTNFVPGIRNAGGDHARFFGSKAPGKIGKLMERAVRTGEVPIDREMDAAIIAKTLFRAVSTEKHLAPHWNAAMEGFKAFADQMPPHVADLFLRYMHNVRHAPDTYQNAMAAGMQRVVDKINELGSFKKVATNLDKSEWRDLVSMMVGWNYQANLAWNPGAVLRQFQQPLQTVMPDMGVNSTLQAMRRAIKWFKGDEKFQKYYEQRGVVTRDVMHERFREIEEVMAQFKPGGAMGRAKEAYDFFRQKGTVAFKKADDFNRIVAYDAMVQHATKPAQEFLAGKKSWIQFVEDSKLDRLDAVDGPFIQVIKERLTGGDVDGAVHEMAFKFMRDTQFVYTRGNNPYIMNGTLGRFFGQYGTWPMQYVEYMRNMIKRGSYKNRVTALSRWAGVNGAIVYGAASVFGVEMSKWSFFSPLGFTGGPFLEMAQQGGSALTLAAQGNVDLGKSWDKTRENWGVPTLVGTKEADLIDRLQAQRLSQNLYSQTVPLPWGQIRRTVEATEMMWNMDYGEALKKFLSLPSTSPGGSSPPIGGY